MEKKITYHIWPRGIKFEEKLALIADFAKKRGLEPGFTYNVIVVDPFQTISSWDMEEFLDLMKHTAAFDSFHSQSDFANQKRKVLTVAVDHRLTHIEVSVDSTDIDLLEAAHAFIRDKLGLRNPEVPSHDEARAKYLQPTVFIGRHFDQVADGYFSSLSTFLKLLGFDIKEGEPYASMSIPEKVKGRIDAQDILICVVSGKGKHPWLVAEPSYALGKGKHVVLLIEEGTDYDSTILGRDLEQVRFPPGHIERSFIPLLEEFRSVRIKGL